MADGVVTDVQQFRMKDMGSDGTRGYVVEVKLDDQWVRILDNGDRAKAERVAAEARREAGL